MNEIADNFAWTRQLECPPTVYNDSVKKMFVHFSYLFTEILAVLSPCLTFSFPSDCAKEYWSSCGRTFPILCSL